MKATSGQIQQRSMNRRLKDTPAKKLDPSSSNTDPARKTRNVISKSLNSDFLAVSEKCISEITDQADSTLVPENGIGDVNSDYSPFSELVDSSEIPTTQLMLEDKSEFEDVTSDYRDPGFISTKNNDSQIAINFIQESRIQVLKSSTLNHRSKKILNAILENVIMDLDVLPEEQTLFHEDVLLKIRIGILCFFLCFVSFLFIFLSNVVKETPSLLPPPT